MRGEATKEEERVITVRFPKGLAQRCQEMAKEQDRSLNGQIVHAVKAWVAWREGQGARPDEVPATAGPPDAPPTGSASRS